jgi:hypothetical protein
MVKAKKRWGELQSSLWSEGRCVPSLAGEIEREKNLARRTARGAVRGGSANRERAGLSSGQGR